MLANLAQLGVGGSNESVNWRVWNTADGMLEGFVSQVSRTPAGRVIVRHGDVSNLDILDGFTLSKLPDTASLGTINANIAGNLYTFDRSGVAVFSGGKWNHYPVPEVAGFAGFGAFEHLHWFEYPFSTDLHPRISAIPSKGGSMLFALASGVVEWSGVGSQRQVLRTSAASAIGDFIQISPAGKGSYFVSGVHGLAMFTPADSTWTELPQSPPGFTRFVFPSRTKNGILVTATGSDGRKRLLSFVNGEWKMIYAGGQQLRGWESGAGQVWALERDRLMSIGNGDARRVDLDPVISGQFNDVVPDGNAFWLATSQGLARYAPPIWQLPGDAPEIRGTVNAISQDKQGTLWFTSGALLYSYSGRRWRTYRLPSGAAQDTGKTNSVCPMDNGHLLLLTNKATHLLEMNVATGSFLTISHPEGRQIGLIERRDGKSIWVQTVERGQSTSRIQIYDGNKFLDVPGAEAIPTTDVRAVLYASDGVLWVGGTGNLVRIVHGHMEIIPREEGLPEASAFSLLEGADHSIYIGHRDALSVYTGNRFRVLRRGLDRTRRFVQAADGSLWAASGTGVHRYKDGIWLTNSSEEGLPSDAAYTVFADREGRIWAGTTLGLRLYHPESDLDPPITFISEDQNQRKAPPGGEVRFAFSGADRWKQTPQPRLLFSWKLDTGQWSPFQSATLTSVQNVKSGSHTFQVRAMDRNGNIDPHPALFQFAVLFPWYRETGFYFVASILALAVLLLFRTGFNYHKNLRFRSRHDTLTHLPNRLQFDQALAAAASQRCQTGFAVLFIDLDGFKGVNDTQGHPEGDKLLLRIGTSLRSNLPKGDLLARIGGDEFAVLHFSNDSRGTAVLLSDVILENVRACSPAGCKVSASIGISLWPEHGVSPSSLVRLADLAMYQSKSRSGDCALLYESNRKVDFESAEMAGSIRAALKNDRLVLWFQPIMDGSGRVVRMECLVRIDDPLLGLIEPNSFIPLAEEAGLIHAIGAWVLNKAANTAREWRERGCDMPVAVNISARQLERTEFAAEVLDILTRFDLPATALVLEVTEGAVAHNQEGATRILSVLRNAGVNISLDDFGTGFSGLSMLDSLPLNEIKLDLSFAANLTSERTCDVVRQSVNLAHKLNLTVVMEGIEESSQFEIAQELGCDLFQGHLLAPPLDRDMATQFILNQANRSTVAVGLDSQAYQCLAITEPSAT